MKVEETSLGRLLAEAGEKAEKKAAWEVRVRGLLVSLLGLVKSGDVEALKRLVPIINKELDE